MWYMFCCIDVSSLRWLSDFCFLTHCAGYVRHVVLPLDMVENSTSPLQTHLRPGLGDEAVQTDHFILEGGSLRALLRVSSPISLRNNTAPTSGFHASQAETDGKG